ncbi:hypothetical protein AKJ09_04477 [Labilithrix luteola]|uniref:Uncharacterized protein n=1 Tax=Labilithrix luteola TaxID=1391654 RepID=A0A0K1PWB8_9BACT|nr:hypothetical protein AKJ09_04477 [Labilithrix luteola]
MEQTDLDQFMRALATAFHGGEVRPTHRRKPTSPRHRRTRIDFCTWASELDERAR